MILCPGCGNESPDDAVFCGFCGHKMQGSAPKKTLFGFSAIPKKDLDVALGRDKKDGNEGEAAAADAPAAKADEPRAPDADTDADTDASADAPAEAPAEPAKPKSDAGTGAKKTSGLTRSKPDFGAAMAALGKKISGQSPAVDKKDDVEDTAKEIGTKPALAGLQGLGLDDGWKLDDDEGDDADKDESATGPTTEALVPIDIADGGDSPVGGPATLDDSLDGSTVPDLGPAAAAAAAAMNAERNAAKADGPTENDIEIGEAVLKSGQQKRLRASEPKIVADGAKTYDEPAATAARKSRSGVSGKPTERIQRSSPNIAAGATAPRSRSGKEDEESFFGASLSQYHMMPVRKEDLEPEEIPIDEEISRAHRRRSLGLMIGLFVVLSILIGAIVALAFIE